jgi:hypothetical protein
MSSYISDIRIDSEGIWFYKDMEMSRRDIVALFYKHLVHDASGGYFIEIGFQRYPLDVEDTAYVVWSAILNDAENSIILVLSDYTAESLVPSTLRIGNECMPYCKVKDGRFDARFSRPAYYSLAERIELDPQRDAYYLQLKGHRYYLL